MSGDIERAASTDSWVPVLGAVGDLAQRLAATQFVPRGMQRQPASVAAAILTGREMGLGPMASLRGIDVIEGKPALTAQMLAARILAAGHRIEWVNATDTKCTVRIERGDGLSTAEVTWTLADAQRAGLAGKKVWQQYPRHMLRARAISECAAMACPDVMLGLDVLDAPGGTGEPAGGVPTTVVQLPDTGRESASEQIPEPQERPVEPPTADPVEEPAQPVQDATEPPPAPLVTRQQLTKMNAQLGELERADGRRMTRDEKRDIFRTLAELDTLDSAKDLTREQASTVIEGLTRAIESATVVDAVIVEPERP